LKDTFASRGLDISRPDGHVNKVVADGAVSFYIDHFVASRVSKLAYGTEVFIRFQPQNPDHILRSDKKFQDLTGDTVIDGLFSVILPKNTKVAESQEFRKGYRQQASNPANFRSILVDVMCYRGSVCLKESASNWFMDKDAAKFSTLCQVEADTSLVSVSPKLSRNQRSTYYEIEFDIILSLGLTELKAQVSWIENGIEKRSPAQVVYDPEVIIKD